RRTGPGCRGAWSGCWIAAIGSIRGWRGSTSWRAGGSTRAGFAARIGSMGADQPQQGGLFLCAAAEAAEALVEARELAAGVVEALLAAGPGRMRLRIDVEAQRVAGLPIGRPGLVAGAVGHHDGDLVIIGVDLFLHGAGPSRRPAL